jgi:sulfite reductase beta subunit-like hemoprotein
MPAEQELSQVERDKLEINPDFDFCAIGKRDLDALTPNEIAMFKWSGVYHQLQRGYFMIRLRIPGGLLTSAQLARAGELATSYGQDHLCITTRQTLQYHWIRLADIHKIIDGMKPLGILTKNACGDVCRNVVSCSLQGVCPHEIADTGALVMALADDPVLRDQQRNLPRKHKISVSGCASSCGQALMNCQGWYPVKRENPDGTSTTGWALTAGGGLGALPHMGKLIFDWVPQDLVVPVARAVVESHNRYGNRRVRKYARLKIVVAEMGVETYRQRLLGILAENGVTGLDRLEAADARPALAPIPFAGESVIPQRDADRCTVRVIIPRSEISGGDAVRFAGWASEFGSGTVALTNRQNLEIRDVPAARVADLQACLNAAGWCTEGFEMLPDIVACVGTTLCNLAVSDTPAVYRHLTEAFADDPELTAAVGPLRINMNGCPNSCAQHWIADIGLRGRRFRSEKGGSEKDGQTGRPAGSEEGFALFAGGRLDAAGHVGEHVIDIASTDAVPAIRGLLALYLEERTTGETFGDYARRQGGSQLGRKLAEALSLRPHEPLNQRNTRLQQSLMNVFEEMKLS